jgi:hypothetical protein
MKLNESLSRSDEREVERIVRATVKDELEKKVEQMVRAELKGKANEKLIIQIVKNAMTSLYKTLWMRRATWLSGIENKEN